MGKFKFSIAVVDCDGVIVDRMPSCRDCFVEILSPFGLPRELTSQYYYHTAGTPINQQFLGALAEKGISISDDKIEIMVKEFFKKAESHSPKLFTNAKKVLKELRELDKRICVTSGSKTEDLKDLFTKHELPYDAVIGSDSIPKGDGHIEYFAKSLGMRVKDFCSRAIYLGDGPRDMEIARQNNIFAVGITTTVTGRKLKKAGANTIIREIKEFLEIVS